MTEKVIHEVRFIETDEGFRIEINGDKERMREMGFFPGMGFMRGMGCGPGRRFARHMRRAARHMHGWGPWWDREEDEEPEAKSDESDA
jgi:hypothetical protein